MSEAFFTPGWPLNFCQSKLMKRRIKIPSYTFWTNNEKTFTWNWPHHCAKMKKVWLSLAVWCIAMKNHWMTAAWFEWHVIFWIMKTWLDSFMVKKGYPILLKTLFWNHIMYKLDFLTLSSNFCRQICNKFVKNSPKNNKNSSNASIKFSPTNF